MLAVYTVIGKKNNRDKNNGNKITGLNYRNKIKRKKITIKIQHNQSIKNDN